jgi:hypothetical protein
MINKDSENGLLTRNFGNPSAVFKANKSGEAGKNGKYAMHI